jgi:alpha-galactosidase
MAAPSFAAPADQPRLLAATPPMGWNDWAHYQCDFTAQTILSNAHALVKSGLAARGYDTVTIDDCWMQKDRDANGNLQVDPHRFPQGMKPIAQAVHALGLKFGIYEDAGYETCGKFAGSGDIQGGGKNYFILDTKLFASWGVDYLKLDGCKVYVSHASTQIEAYRKAYAAQSAALKNAGRPVVFSESAPAYFQGTPEWYDVLSWVRGYGQLWREGDDIATFDPKNPNVSRFRDVLWNYAYNLPLGRFHKPGNWNDSDFIIGGDSGMTLAETRSQLTLWAMMSAPLILSSDLDKLSPESVAILGKKNVIAIDQDALGRMVTLVRRSPVMDILFKPLRGGDYAIAVLNHGTAPIQANLNPADFGFAANKECRLDVRNLWSGDHEIAASSVHAEVATHDTEILRIHPTSSCGVPTSSGTITMITTGKSHEVETYSRCLSTSGSVSDCAGNSTETWTVTASGALKSGGSCLALVDHKPVMQACAVSKTQHWNYTIPGNLVGADGECLTAIGPDSSAQSLSVRSCEHNSPDQIWSLPNRN